MARVGIEAAEADDRVRVVGARGAWRLADWPVVGTVAVGVVQDAWPVEGW